MEFSLFFNKLKLQEIKSSAASLLERYKSVCETEGDFLQLYELKSIFEARGSLFVELIDAYFECNKTDYSPLYDKIEALSDELENIGVSCYSYSYYIYVFLKYIFAYDEKRSVKSKGLAANATLDEVKWTDPRGFDYQAVGKNNTFGVNVNSKHKGGFTAAIPSYSSFECRSTTLLRYVGSKPYVVIPDHITSISSKAFSGNKKVKMIIMPDSVVNIEAGAFADCDRLNLVHLGKKIKKIPDNCFLNCKNLKYIGGQAVRTVGKAAFKLCVQLKSLNADMLDTVDAEAFYGCAGLDDFDFVGNLKSIGNGAFTACKIEELFLNDCDYLGTNAFAGCTELKKITLNRDIDLVGEAPFLGCKNLVDLKINFAPNFKLVELFAENETEFEAFGYTFDSVRLVTLTAGICSGLKKLRTAEITGRSSVPESAFRGCESLTEIIFRVKRVDSIEDFAFENCRSLRSLDIDFFGKEIGEAAFYKCSALKNFDFLRGVTKFGAKALAYDNLTEFDFCRPFEYIGPFAFANAYFAPELNIELRNANVSAGAFHGASEINLLSIEGCSLDREYIFALFERTKEDFAARVTVRTLLTDYAAAPHLFEKYNCDFISCRLEGDEVPEYLFADCRMLTGVKLDGRVASVGEAAFTNCSELGYVDTDFSDSLHIEARAFENCKQYVYERLADTEYIGERAFYNSGLRELVLGEKTEYIGDNAFGACKLAKTAVLPFLGNSDDKEAPFGRIFSNEIVADDEVQMVSDAEKYYIPRGIRSLTVLSAALPANALKNCYFLEEIKLPFITSLSEPCFQGCNELKALTLGARLKELRALSFVGLPEKTKISVSEKNPRFEEIDGSILSKNHDTLYFSKNGELPRGVTVIKSFAVTKYAKPELKIAGIKTIESNAIDISSVQRLTVADAPDLGKHAFLNGDSLKYLTLLAEGREYKSVIKLSSETPRLKKLVCEDASEFGVKKLFSGATEKISVEELVLKDMSLCSDALDGVTAQKLELSKCSGRTELVSDVAELSLYHCSPFGSLIGGRVAFGSVTIARDYVSVGEIDGLTCEKLVVKAPKKLSRGAIRGVCADKLTVLGSAETECGAILDCRFEKIEFRDSDCVAENGLVYKDGKLVYYRPFEKKAVIPPFIESVTESTADLTNATSLEIPRKTRFEKNSFYHSDGLEELTCGGIDGCRLSDLFDDVTSLRKITYVDEELPRKFLSRLPALETVVLPESIRSLGDFSLAHNPRLTSVTNLSAAKIYGDGLLRGSASLPYAEFNADARHIGFDVADGCTALRGLSMPILPFHKETGFVLSDLIKAPDSNLNVTITKGDIPEAFFKNNDISVSVLSSPREVSSHAFENVRSVEIDLKKTELIGDGAFARSAINRSIRLDSCRIIGARAFAECRALKEITLSPLLESFGADALKGVATEKLSMPHDGKRYRVFCDCLIDGDTLIYRAPASEKEGLALDGSVRTIAKRAFSGCNLKLFSAPAVEKVERAAFIDCKMLSEVTFGRDIPLAEKGIFVDCDGLTKLTVDRVAQGELHTLSDFFGNKGVGLAELVITGDVLEKDDLSCDNSLSSVILSDKIRAIPNSYFSHCGSLRQFSLPEGCLSVGENAFRGCGLLTEMTVPAGCSVQKDAFADCNGIKTLVLEEPVEDFLLSYYGIGTASALETVVLSKATLAEGAFAGYRSLRALRLGEVVTDIPDACFEGCENLALDEEFFLGLQNIGAAAFRGCNTPSRIELRDASVLGENAFEDCRRLNSVTIGDNIRTIPRRCFFGCSRLKKIALNGGLERIEEAAFGETALDRVVIPSTIVYVGSQIFENKTKKVKVVLPEKKFDFSAWASDWSVGLKPKHSVMRFLNPKVKLKNPKKRR